MQSNDLTIGQIFKQARMHANLSISDIARKTKINSAFIKYIEEDNFKDLPEKTYVLGYVMALSKLLELDKEKMVKLIKEKYDLIDPTYDHIIQNNNLQKQFSFFNQTKRNLSNILSSEKNKDSEKIVPLKEVKNVSTDKKEESLIKDSKSSRYPSSNKFTIIAGIIVVAITLIIILVSLLKDKDPKVTVEEKPVELNSNVANELNLNSNDGAVIVDKKNTIESPQESTENKAPVEEKPVAPQAQTQAEEQTSSSVVENSPFPTKEQSSMKLVFKGQSWVKIYSKVYGAVYINKLYRKGDSLVIPKMDNLIMNVNDYNNVIFTVEGKAINFAKMPNINGSLITRIMLKEQDLVDNYSNN